MNPWNWQISFLASHLLFGSGAIGGGSSLDLASPATVIGIVPFRQLEKLQDNPVDVLECHRVRSNQVQEVSSLGLSVVVAFAVYCESEVHGGSGERAPMAGAPMVVEEGILRL